MMNKIRHDCSSYPSLSQALMNYKIMMMFLLKGSIPVFFFFFFWLAIIILFVLKI
jgi:hypothetical protein